VRPYTGLKPAGAVEPGIAAPTGRSNPGRPTASSPRWPGHLDEGVRHRLERVLAAASTPAQTSLPAAPGSPAYVDFIHYVEGLDVALAGSGHGAAPAGQEAHAH